MKSAIKRDAEERFSGIRKQTKLPIRDIDA